MTEGTAPTTTTNLLPPVVTGQMEIGPEVKPADLGVNAEPADDGDEDACVVCGDHLEDGDQVYWSSNDDGHMHAECAKSYVDDEGNETSEPPEPMVFRSTPTPAPRLLICQCVNSKTDPCIVCGKGKTLATAEWISRMALLEDGHDATTGSPAPAPQTTAAELSTDHFRDATKMVSALTRPIVGIENRTAQEVLDIMVDRIRRASQLPAPPALWVSPTDLRAWQRSKAGEIWAWPENVEGQCIPLYHHPQTLGELTRYSMLFDGEEGWDMHPFDDGEYVKYSDVVALFVAHSPAPQMAGWQPMETAPHDETIVVWWPIVALDEDGDPTDTVEDGRAVVTEWNGGYWLEPDVLNAIGDHLGDDCIYADNPSHWMPLPGAPIATPEGSE